MPQDALDDLVALLDLEPIEVNIFRGQSPDEQRQRVFGGQVAGQALVAAGRTVERGVVHSLHAYFLRPGDPTIPIIYEVDRIRDGRSFTTRRVVAVQHGRAIFNLSASFHVPEQGLDHQRPMPMGVPDPESLPPYEWGRRQIDLRFVPPEARGGHQRVWMRADGPLPDDPLLHACVVAYASDMTLLDSATRPHGMSFDGGAMASLDHAMWFHRSFRADEWLLYDQHSPTAAEARGLATGTIFSQDGRLVVSVVQEGLMRSPARPSETR